MAYSMEFRVAVANAYDDCGSSGEVAEMFHCSASWVRRLMQRRREDGSLAPRPLKLPNNNKLGEPDLQRLRKLIADRPDVQAARAGWFAKFAGVKVKQLVFLDEFGATTHMTRSHARGPRGKRVVCKNPAGHWKVLSTIAAMTVRGMISCGIFEGATDTDAFT